MIIKLRNFLKNFYNVYLTGLTILVSLPVLAPVLLKLGLEGPAKVIYFIYSFFCHQIAYRSFDLFDYQFAWCSRDTGIWLGIWITAILLKFNKIKGIKWYWVLPFMVPIALDGGLQTIFTMFNISSSGALLGMPLYVSTNFTRFMTGSVFGIGLSLWLSPLIKEDVNTVLDKAKELGNNTKGFLKSNISKILLLCLCMIPLYLVIFGFWDLTSTVNKPLYPLDEVVKSPVEGFLARRQDAVCPTEGVQDFLNFDCFFSD